ncbi:MAG: AIR synthase-related protein, partial [Kiritimatiellia bacterium]|nr:AIR synthase-related protein [Kiritimatiellia bacterium]
MAYRIEIGLKDGVRDAGGEALVAKARQSLAVQVQAVRTRTVYKIDAEITEVEIKSICRFFCDPVIESAAVGRLPPPSRFDWLIEIGYKPGVTDNVGRTARVALQDIVGRTLPESAQVYTATQYFIQAKGMPRVSAQKLAANLLANQLIQTITLYSADEWGKAPVDTSLPVIQGEDEGKVGTYDLSGSDQDLLALSRENILSLSVEEMHAIRDYFRMPAVRKARRALGLPDQPTDVELECIAQTWSEHCSHKIFAAKIKYTDEHGRVENIDSLFKTYVRAATEKTGKSVNWLVSVFKDNAGIIRFNNRLNLVYKIETHNSPSALDPYGGAMTGIVGVNRDPMGTGMGANLLCNVWGYCLGSPFFKGKLPKGLMPPRRIRDGVHQGVIEGGNQSGIPWMRGFEIFDERYTGKPLVFCGTVGTLPVKVGGRPSERKEVFPGDTIVMLGGRIGKDGIHGATFSSEELREKSPVQAVQIGDPITQRKMYEFLMEARDLGLYRCITDNGAGGLSCSVGEMGRMSGGADIDLAKAPLKYKGLKPWEILLSEAQERMTLAVAPDKIKPFIDLAKRRDVEATGLGTFTASPALIIRYKERVVGRLDMNFLYDGCPILRLEARWNPPKPAKPRIPFKGKNNRNALLCDLLSDLNICSKEFKSRQYDGEVKGLSVVKPFTGVMSDMPADATVMRVEYGSNEGIVLAEGINPFYSDLDAYHMAASVIDEAVRRIVGAGGRFDRIAGLDNFCWPDPALSEKTPDGLQKLAQLVRANKALYDITTAYGVPCISGKDSCKNDSTRGGKKISIPPTLLFSTIAKIDDVREAITPDFKQAGDLIYVIGFTRNELGASAFYRLLERMSPSINSYGGKVPEVDPELGRRIYTALSKAVKLGIVRSAHTPTRGGLAVGFTLCSLGGNLGAKINSDLVPRDENLTDDELLFSESNSRFVVSVTVKNRKKLETIFMNIPWACVGGVTTVKRLTVQGIKKRKIISIGLDNL